MTMELVLATRNKGKIKELQELLAKTVQNLHVLGLDAFPALGEIPEPGSTFAENALHKARTVAEATGLISLADDSGLEVDGLHGAPGIFSARFAGPQASDGDNTSKLLHELGDAGPEARRARFRCVLAAWSPNGQHMQAEGSWEGRIALSPRGEHGFGYDPVFVDLQSGLTAAEMDPKLKNERSHRAMALNNFVHRWPDFIRSVTGSGYPHTEPS
jgi:XTP/dITP diphosphohydrolase